MNKNVATTVFTATMMGSTLAAAATPETYRFTRDGESYVYTVASQGAQRIIDGYSQTTGVHFHLTVRNGVVSGVSDDQPVRFRVADASSAKPIETAAR